MTVPLRARGRSIGAISFVAAESGIRYDEQDLELAEDLARRAALAIDNSMLFKREHETAVVLQRSLLPQSLPELEGIDFAARYEPAAPGLEVGRGLVRGRPPRRRQRRRDDRRRRRARRPRRLGHGPGPPGAARGRRGGLSARRRRSGASTR